MLFRSEFQRFKPFHELMFSARRLSKRVFNLFVVGKPLPVATRDEPALYFEHKHTHVPRHEQDVNLTVLSIVNYVDLWDDDPLVAQSLDQCGDCLSFRLVIDVSDQTCSEPTRPWPNDTGVSLKMDTEHHIGARLGDHLPFCSPYITDQTRPSASWKSSPLVSHTRFLKLS